MQNYSQRSGGRPLLFNTKAQVHQFVLGNASQAYSVNMPFVPQKTVPSFYPNSSFFDRYNRPNLLLRDCDPKDIVILHKNLVISEKPLGQEIVEKIVQKTNKNKINNFIQTGELFKKENNTDNLLQTAPIPKITKQYQQNQIIFNYNQMGKVKRDQKKQFLSEIQNRIAEAEREIADFESLQEEERAQMADLTHFQQKIGEQLTKNVEVGYLKQKVGYVTGFEEQRIQKPLSIHKQMGSVQINEIVEDHIKINENLLELAGSVRRKSQEKVKQNLQKTQDNLRKFSSTAFKDNRNNKTMANTMKTGMKPPKSSFKK